MIRRLLIPVWPWTQHPDPKLVHHLLMILLRCPIGRCAGRLLPGDDLRKYDRQNDGFNVRMKFDT
jgi:hypothetical protein